MPALQTLRRSALVVATLALAACASSGGGGRGDSVGGLFDDERVDHYDRSAPTAAPGGYGGGGGADAPMAVAEAAPAPRGAAAMFERMEEAVDGAFDKPSKSAEPPGPPPPPPPPPRPGDPDSGRPKPVEGSEGASPARRLVIYTGSLQVMVTNVVESADKLQARIEGVGGYVMSRNGSSSANNVTMTVRVPAEHFYPVVKDLAGYGQLLNEEISAQDVSKKVFDLELRLDTAEKSRQRLVDLLKQATKMEEILQIEGQIRRLTDEIESMKGELRFLKDQVAFSTLTVGFISNAPPPTPYAARTRSRFEWINAVGIERVLGDF